MKSLRGADPDVVLIITIGFVVIVSMILKTVDRFWSPRSEQHVQQVQHVDVETTNGKAGN